MRHPVSSRHFLSMQLGLPQLPEWMLKLVFFFACLGAMTALLGVVWLITWVILHLRWAL